MYRLKYPEASLSELSEIMTLETGKSVSKSGLNHRFRKIKEMYDKLIQSKMLVNANIFSIILSINPYSNAFLLDIK